MRVSFIFLPPCVDTSPRGWWATEIIFGQGRDGRPGLPVRHRTAVLAVGDWTACPEGFRCTVEDAEFSGTLYVPVTVDNACVAAAALAQLLPSPFFEEGRMTLYAAVRPEAQITIHYSLLS